jgi:hypothetical protein
MNNNRLLMLLSVLIFYGCAAAPTKGYREAASVESTSGVIQICRLSTLFQAARRPDIILNDQLVTDIGNGEVISFPLEKNVENRIRVELSSYGSSIAPSAKMALRFSTEGYLSVHYYILSVGLDNVGPSISGGAPGIMVSSNWSIRKVSGADFLDRCGTLKVRNHIRQR